MGNDLFAQAQVGVADLFNGPIDIFLGTGITLFQCFAAIMLVLYGVKMAFSATDGGALHMGQFLSLVMRLMITYTLIMYYNVPIPGIGVSFVHLISDETQWLVNALSVTKIKELFDVLTDVQTGMPYPSFYEVGAIFEVLSLMMALTFAQAAIFIVISFGYIAVAVIVLLGPLFIPFLIVPEMEWLFWGWARSYLQYAFYPVVGAAYTYVWAFPLVNFFKSLHGPITAEWIATHFAPAMVLLITFIYGLLKITSLVHGLFTGHAGDYVLPRFWAR